MTSWTVCSPRQRRTGLLLPGRRSTSTISLAIVVLIRVQLYLQFQLEVRTILILKSAELIIESQARATDTTVPAIWNAIPRIRAAQLHLFPLTTLTMPTTD